MMMDELLDLDNPNLTHFTTQRRSFPFLSCTINNRLRSARKRLKKGLISMAKETMNRQAPSRDAKFAEKIAEMLEDAWSVRREGNYKEGRRILKEAEDLCPENDDQSWGRIYAVYAQYDRDNGDLESALELSKRSLEHYEKSGNQGRIAHIIRHIADIQSGLGRHTEAEESYKQALKIYRESSETDAHVRANATRPYGIMLKKLGRMEEAKELLLEANALYKEAGNQAGVDETDSLLGGLSGL